ncbi:MAG: hypothetical protein JWP36_1455, partial [Paucimonas sp.]|nr:hypothetical protein [Paucimonas sp.]
TTDVSPLITNEVNEINVALNAALQTVLGNSAEEIALRNTISSALKVQGVGVGSVSGELGQKILGDMGSAEAAAGKVLQSLEAPLGILQFTLAPEVIETPQQLAALKEANLQAYNDYMAFKETYQTELRNAFSSHQQMVKIILPTGTVINSYLKPVFQTDAAGQFVVDQGGNKVIVRYEDFSLQTVLVNGQQMQTGAKYFDTAGNEIRNIKSLSVAQLASANLAYVELYFVDNQRGDDDKTIGAIVDPGVFALVTSNDAPRADPAVAPPAPVLAPVVIADTVPPVAFRVDVSLPVPERPFTEPVFSSLLKPSQIAFSTESGFEDFGGSSLQRFSFSQWNARESSDPNFTLNIGWQAMVLAAGDANLTVFRGMGDQFAESKSAGSFPVPPDAFVHTKSDAWVDLVAELSDGSPLPKWLQFDSKAGVFKYTAPDKFQGDLKIKLTAHDNAGREARTMFRFQVGDQKAKIGGRPSFSDQLKGAAKSGASDLSKSLSPTPTNGSREPAKPA